jgi:two-component system chemotaxis sensor kinase CheA
VICDEKKIMDEFEIEIKKDFLHEARELLSTTENSFLDLEKNPQDKSLLDAIFRFAHNLKGTSRAVGFGQIAELTHTAENLLLAIKENKVVITDEVVSTLLLFNDKVREMIDGLYENIEATFEFSDLIEFIHQIENGELKTQPNFSNGDISPAEIIQTDKIPSAEEFLEEIRTDEGDTFSEVQVIPLSVKTSVKKELKKEDETIRVSLERIGELNDLVGELVILQAVVESSLIKFGDHKVSRSLGKLCKDIQGLSMSLRMVPVGPTFQKLNRVVRDTSKTLNKKVELKLIGEETEIDKTVVESLGDPLVHIIRNAIDHGVESPEVRVSQGKPEIGVVEVYAFHEGNNLVIQITDDGKGIDPQILQKKAKEKKILGAHTQLSDQQAIELIFHPGFSSKEVVSEVSGRGVGMDVVKTNIEQLGGEVKVRSKVGSGSCFRLILPLTLAIIDGMIIQSSNQTYVIPRGQVQEVIRIEKKNLHHVTGRRPYLELRESVIPVFYLSEDFGSIDKINQHDIAVVVKNGEHLFAVGIQDILRQQQIVVKPPTKEILGRPGVMGTTILGDGRPAVIIDLLNLYGKLVKKESASEVQRAA